MEPYEVLITKINYGNDDDERIEIVFGPKLIFAYNKDSATKKAVVESGVSIDDINDVFFYVRNFS